MSYRVGSYVWSISGGGFITLGIYHESLMFFATGIGCAYAAWIWLQHSDHIGENDE